MKDKKPTLRMCIACHEMKEKKEMMRIVKSSDGEVSLDKTGKKNGRGAYICDNEACLKKCVKARLVNKAFKCEIPADIYNRLLEDYLVAKGQN